MAAFKYREEIVGKRFLCVPACVKLKRTRNAQDLDWRRGVVRAASHKDIKSRELNVLVEFDNQDWKKREWIKIYDQNAFQTFFIENTLVWVNNKETSVGKNVLWPALNFKSLLDKPGLADSRLKPIEFFVDKRIEFIDNCDLKVHQDPDWENYNCCKQCPEVKKAVREWTEFQDGQRILLTTPSVLIGYRVKVYRSEGTTQWYTAVIVSYNENTRELTLTDDTVLEKHNEDPSLVQMKLIGNGRTITESKNSTNSIGHNKANQAKNSTLSNSSNQQQSSAASKTKRSSTRSTKNQKKSDSNNKRESANNLVKSNNNQTNSKKSSNSKSKELKENSSSDTEVDEPQRQRRTTKTTKKCAKKDQLEADQNTNESSEEVESSPVNSCENVGDSNSAAEVKSSGKGSTVNRVKNGDNNNSCIANDTETITKSGDQSVVESSSEAASNQPQSPTSTERVITSVGEKKAEDKGSAISVQDEKLYEKEVEKEAGCNESKNMVPTIIMCSSDEQSNAAKPNDGDKLDSNPSTKQPNENKNHLEQESDTSKTSTAISSANTKRNELNDCTSRCTSLRIDRHESVTVYRDPNLANKQNIRHIDSLQHGLMHPVVSTTASTAAVTSTSTVSSTIPTLPTVVPPPPTAVPTTITRLASSTPLSCQTRSSPATTASTGSLPSAHFSMSTQSLHPNTQHLLTTGHAQANSVDHQMYRQMLPGIIPGYNQLEVMWQQKNFQQHLPAMAANASWSLFSEQMRAQMMQNEHDRQQSIRMDRERDEREIRFVKTEKEQVDKEKRVRPEQIIKEERSQREAVQQHFEESLNRLAQQKKIGWSPISSLPLTKTQTNTSPSLTPTVQHPSSIIKSFNQRDDREKLSKEVVHCDTRKSESAGRCDSVRCESGRWPVNYMQQQHGNFINLQEEMKHKPKAEVHYQQKTTNGPTIITTLASPIVEQLSQQNVNRAKTVEPSFSLYGYQPTQHTYITPAQLKENIKLSNSTILGPPKGSVQKTPPQAHCFDKRESRELPLIIDSRSMTPNRSTPLGRPPSLSPKQQQKMVQDRISPMYQRNQTTFKPYDLTSNNNNNMCNNNAPPAHQSSLNRATPHPMISSQMSSFLQQQQQAQQQPQNLVKIDNKSQLRPTHNAANSQVDCTKIPSTLSSKLSTGYPHNLIQQGLVPNPLYTVASTTHSTTTTGATSDLSQSISKANFSSHFSTQGPGIVSGIPICRSNSVNFYSHERQQVMSPQKYSLSTNIRTPFISKDLTTPSLAHISVSQHPQQAHHHQAQVPQLNASDRSISLIQRTSSASHSPRIVAAPVHSPYGPPPGGSVLPVTTSSMSFTTPPPAAHSGISPINLNNKRKVNESSPSKKQKARDEPVGKLNNNNNVQDVAKTKLQEVQSATLSKQSAVLKETPPKSSTAIELAEVKQREAIKPSECDNASEHFIPKHHKAKSVARNYNDVNVNDVMENGENSNNSELKASSNSASHLKLKKAWLQRHSDQSEDKIVDCVANVKHATKANENSGNASCSIEAKLKNNDSLINVDLKNDLPNDDEDDDETSSASETEQEINRSEKSERGKLITRSVGRKRVIPQKVKEAVKKRKADNGKPDEMKLSKENEDKKKKEKSSKEIAKETLRLASKRGRKPKNFQKDDDKVTVKVNKESASKKKKESPKKNELAERKKSGAPFLQGGSCVEVAPKLPKCRECRMTATQRNRKPTIFCRFYDYRKLAYKNNVLTISGFSQPGDASEEDLRLWLPSDNKTSDLDVDTAKFLLTHVGDQFCDLVKQEKEAQILHSNSGSKNITWKRVVQGVREMCDVCETTLFNIHWVCDKCGFVVCIDCYKARTIGSVKEEKCPPKDRDGFQWLLCNNRQQHEPQKLEVTQIIAASALSALGRMLHADRAKWKIPGNCSCTIKDQFKRSNGYTKQVLGVVKLENKQVNGFNENGNKQWKGVNGSVNLALIKQESDLTGYSSESGNSPLSFFVDVALTSEKLMSKTAIKDDNDLKSKKKSQFKDENDDSDEVNEDDEDNKHSTLRELLMGPTSKCSKDKAGDSPINGSDLKNREALEQAKEEHCQLKEGQLLHFTRRSHSFRREVEPLPIVSRQLEETKKLFPSVPHLWFCSGKLLMLLDPNNKNNTKLFQEQWIRGQPVIVKDVHKSLTEKLWHPDSFTREFGDIKNDLVNCKNGDILTKQPMKKFWDGFESLQNRLKEKNGEHMILKLKDWPPDEEFSELLPTRYKDLMNSLPLPEYTNRNGILNLAGRLPDTFVRPDLGPKMYSAYGLSQHPDKGTTNLHIDISDAINVLIFVGIPKENNKDLLQDAFNAADSGGCDELMKSRVREKAAKLGALWHIYNARDADKIRDLLNKVAIERGEVLEPHHDPIHDQSWYLDDVLRDRLYKEYGVEGYAIAQCQGDAILIPAGAPHQVRNLQSCIKVAGDFVSPENVAQCFNLTQEFRQLSDSHNNHEDKLQIKNIIYHAVKDALSSLRNHQPNTN